VGEMNLLVGEEVFGEGDKDDSESILRASLTNEGILPKYNSSEKLRTGIRELGVGGNRSAFGNVAIDETRIFVYREKLEKSKFMKQVTTLIFILQSDVDSVWGISTEPSLIHCAMTPEHLAKICAVTTARKMFGRLVKGMACR
jgi:hypothetical protein